MRAVDGVGTNQILVPSRAVESDGHEVVGVRIRDVSVAIVQLKSGHALSFNPGTEGRTQVDVGNSQVGVRIDVSSHVVTRTREVHRTVAGVTAHHHVVGAAEPGAAAAENRRALVGRILPDPVGDRCPGTSSGRLPIRYRIGLRRSARAPADIHRVPGAHTGNV